MTRASLPRAHPRYLELLRRPIWIFDLDGGAHWWANAAALVLFAAETVEELAARHRVEEMSDGMRRRLATYREHFLRGEHVVEDWTFYPEGKAPVTATCACSGVLIHDPAGRRLGMLVEATPRDAGLGGDERRLVEALRHCNDRISLYDPQGRTLLRNPAAEQALGLVGERSSEATSFASTFVDPDVAQRVLDVAMAGEVFHAEVRVRTTEGEAWYDTEARSVSDPVTGAAALLCIQHDISARRSSELRLAGALREADALRAKAESANHAKSAFLAMMSHELRTPMTGALAAAEVLRHSDLTDDQRELLEMVLEGGQQMVSLVDDILDISRIEAGRLPVDPRVVDPAQLLRRGLRPLHAAAARKGLQLQHRLGEVPARVSLDPTRFGQVVTNLVSNAIKFSDEGPVVVRLESKGPDALRLEVRDRGPGIPATESEAIFAAFRRGDDPAIQARGGVGLGLYIVQAIVRALGGELGVESAPGRGATFWVEVPAPSAEASPAPAVRSARPPSLDLSVMVVDDNHLNRRSIARMLRSWGCRVTEAQDGEEALARVHHGLDVVLMDVNMPRRDGPSTVAAIRAGALIEPHAPIFALTADVFYDTTNSRFDDLLTKPVDWEALHARLAQLAHAR